MLPKVNKILEHALGNDKFLGQNKTTVSIVRSFMFAGAPLDGFNSSHDRYDLQRSKLRKLHRNFLIPMLEEISVQGVGPLLFNYYSESILDVYVVDRTLKDLPLLVGIICFIFIMTFVRVGSFFIAFFSTLATGNCFFLTHVLYIVLVQANYLAVYHLLSAFILFALGTYNLFIIYDMWLETETIAIKGVEALP